MIALSSNLLRPVKPVNAETRSSTCTVYSFTSSACQNSKITLADGSNFVNVKTHSLNCVMSPNQAPASLTQQRKMHPLIATVDHSSHVRDRKILLLCGVGCWMQGFRCFPWLALNFYLANALNMHPSTLQIVQYSVNLPMVAKPLYGLLSDAFYIGESHRIPYISLGAFMQALSWGAMALLPVTDAFLLMACIFLGNLGASITEVANDALVAETGKEWKMAELQSYAFLSLVSGGLLGNLSGGLFLQRTEPKLMFFVFSVLLVLQLATSLATKEAGLYHCHSPNQQKMQMSVSRYLSQQFAYIITTVNQKSISDPLSWVVASVALVPVFSGATFCYLTQSLTLSPSVIGMSKVMGQLMILLMTFFSIKYLRRMPMRKLICGVQITYAFLLLSDWLLVKQLNVKLGIPNEIHVLCLSSLAEAVSQFKLLPFSVLFANLSPPGSEGSLIAVYASALCLSSMLSGFIGVGLTGLFRISEDYSALSTGIILQFITALLPLRWISRVPISQTRGRMKRRRRSRKSLSMSNSRKSQKEGSRLWDT